MSRFSNPVPARISLLAMACGLVACSVPQAALDQANNAGNLMQQMRAQEDKLARAQALVAKGRISNIAEQRELILSYNAHAQLDKDVDAAAGDSQRAGLYNTLQTLSDRKAKLAQEQQTALVALRERLDKVLAPVPSNAASSAEAQKAISALGVQRSTKESVAFVVAYAKTLKAESAPLATPAASSASAPHQAAPPTAPASTAGK